jgi:hypothetical protein
MDLIVNSIFIGVQTMITIGFCLIIWSSYLLVNFSDNCFQDTISLKRERLVSQIFAVLPAFIALAFLVDSLLRLRRLSTGALVISKKLMYYHVGAFGLFALSAVLLMLDLHKKEIFPELKD